MRNNSLALSLSLTISLGCSSTQPKVADPEVTVPRVSSSTDFVDNDPLPTQERPEPELEITEAMRDRIHAKCFHEIWDLCGSEVNELFFRLTKRVPLHEDRKCREDGDYAPGCMYRVFEQYIPTDPDYLDYKKKDKACEQALQDCYRHEEAACDKVCWQKAKQEAEEIERDVHQQMRKQDGYRRIIDKANNP